MNCPCLKDKECHIVVYWLQPRVTLCCAFVFVDKNMPIYIKDAQDIAVGGLSNYKLLRQFNCLISLIHFSF